MPAPPAGRCYYPKKKGDRIVWCGNETLCIDKAKGEYAVFCSECMKKYEKALKELKEGNLDKYKRTQLKVRDVKMHEEG